jgi:hypothetical protein
MPSGKVVQRDILPCIGIDTKQDVFETGGEVFPGGRCFELISPNGTTLRLLESRSNIGMAWLPYQFLRTLRARHRTSLFLRETPIGPHGNTREGNCLLRSTHTHPDLRSETVIKAILQNEPPELHCFQYSVLFRALQSACNCVRQRIIWSTRIAAIMR